MPQDVQLYYQFATHGRDELNLAPDARTGFDMALLRMLAFGQPVRVTACPDRRRAVADDGATASGCPGSASPPRQNAGRAGPAAPVPPVSTPSAAAVPEPAPARPRRWRTARTACRTGTS